MKWFWLITSAVIIIIAFKIFKKSAKIINPITSLRFDGTLGMRIGDSYDFIISRLKHLSIRFEDDYKYQKECGMDYWLEIGKNLFNNIMHISIHFNGNDSITSFLIYIDYNKEGKNFMYNFLQKQISLYLRKEEKNVLYNGVTWVQNGFVVGLHNDIEAMYISINKL